MAAILTLVRAGLVLGALGAASLAMLAYFGFAVPEFDLLNHAQIFLFPGDADRAADRAVGLRGRWRLAASGFVALGLLASSSVMVPELLAAMAGRPAAGPGRSSRMMTHNLFGVNYDMDKVSAAILGEDADIIVFQEYFGEQASGSASAADPSIIPISCAAGAASGPIWGCIRAFRSSRSKMAPAPRMPIPRRGPPIFWRSSSRPRVSHFR